MSFTPEIRTFEKVFILYTNEQHGKSGRQYWNVTNFESLSACWIKLFTSWIDSINAESSSNQWRFNICSREERLLYKIHLNSFNFSSEWRSTKECFTDPVGGHCLEVSSKQQQLHSEWSVIVDTMQCDCNTDLPGI